jgi:hypothetical protein
MSDPLRLARAALDDDSEGDVLSPLCKSIIDGTHQTRKRDDRSARLDQIAALTARITKLETAAKRKPSRNKKMTQSDMETLAAAVGNCLGQELKPILERIEKLEAQSLGVKWAGVWSAGTRYHEGELITDRGSLWLAVEKSNGERPGDNAAFRLIVKNGSHGDNGTRRHVTTGTRN